MGVYVKLSEAIALRTKELLRQKNITQYRLFSVTGVPQTTISAVVRALHANVSTTVLFQIASGLGVSMKEFFDSPLFEQENIID